MGSKNRIANYYKSCQKASVEPDQEKYEIGYRQGLQYYCQPSVIFENSLTGLGDYRVCPVSAYAELKPYRNVAYSYYLARKEYVALDEEMERYQNYLLNKKITTEQRDQYIDHITNMKDNYRDKKYNYDQAERNLLEFKKDHGL